MDSLEKELTLEDEIESIPFGERLRAIRKEKGMSQDEFAEIIGTSKQVLSRYEIGQRTPKISQVIQYANRLNVSVDYLVGDNVEESAFNSLCTQEDRPFYKIFIDVTTEMGLDIPALVRVTGLTDRQIRTIILRRMKEAPLPIALRLSDTLGVPLEVWTGDHQYVPREITVEAREVARAYDKAEKRQKDIVRLTLDLPLTEEVKRE